METASSNRDYRKRVLILGGGLSSMAMALALASTQAYDITILEKAPRLGGLAGSFVRGQRSFPLGYHHILRLDRMLLFFMKEIGEAHAIRWKRIRMLFEIGPSLMDIGTVRGFLKLPLTIREKFYFGRLMVTTCLQSDWKQWNGRSAAEFLAHQGAHGARREIFEKLTQLRFGKSCAEISASWLATRLHYREGTARLGYLPARNWTDTLCQGLEQKLKKAGVRIVCNATIETLEARGSHLTGVRLAGGSLIEGDVVVSGLPLATYKHLVPEDQTPGLEPVEYSSLVSVVCSIHRPQTPEFYWLNLASLQHHASAIFDLSSLNPGLAWRDEKIFNFVIHSSAKNGPHLASDDLILQRCQADFTRIFGHEPQMQWSQVNRIPHYCPIFYPDFQAIGSRSTRYTNVLFTGNYRSFPSIMSTGTALASGLQTAGELLAEDGLQSELLQRAHLFGRSTWEQLWNLVARIPGRLPSQIRQLVSKPSAEAPALYASAPTSASSWFSLR